MLKAIIFDFDGVLADTYGINFELSKTFHDGLTEQEFKDHHNGNVFETPKIRFQEGDMPIFLEKQKEQFTREHLFPLKKLLIELNKKFQLFIVSSTSDENIMHFLKLDEYDALFTKVLGATTHPSKVKKFQMIFEQYGISSLECVFITDTAGDVIEARAVNMNAIAVLWGYHDRQTLEAEHPFAIVNNERELRSTLEILSIKNS